MKTVLLALSVLIWLLFLGLLMLAIWYEGSEVLKQNVAQTNSVLFILGILSTAGCAYLWESSGEK